MNLRLTVTAAVAVILASVSVYPLIQAAGWFWAGVGAVIVAAAAGIITRLPTLHAAVAGSVVALVAAAPLLVSPQWGLRVAGAAIVAVTAASRPRLRVLQALACVIIYLAALLIYLNALFASHLSTAGIVPTKASLSYLSTLANQGMAERIFEPPVPSSPGVILLAAGGIGLMAVATDLLAVRLRSPAIAGLPLLALYCVRITTAAHQGGLGATIVFCLAMIGYLALLAADGRERLRIWGRLVTVWHGAAADPVETPDTKALAASGRRIGLAAACIALAFPLLVPGISVHDLLKTDPTTTGSGGPPVALPTPLAQMQDQLLSTSPRTVLTYTTTARNPREQYLQVYVLNYDQSGQAWTLAPLGGPTTQVSSGQLRPGQGVTDRTPLTKTTTWVKFSQVSTGYDAKLKLGFLPLPYAAETLQAQGSWTEDDATLMVYSASAPLSGLSYKVTSEAADLDSADGKGTAYPKSISGSYLDFQPGPHNELAKLAGQIAARAHAHTPYQKALALQYYFTRSGKFSYSTSVSLLAGIPGLIQFLYHTKTGYCQQFAFAMAGLARLLGIPSRIAVGYTAGSPAGRRGTWKVTTGDAHAWPELYFTGLGWIRFEPTPGGPGGQGTATAPDFGAPPGVGIQPTTPPGQSSRSKAGLGAGAQNEAHLHNLGLSGTGTASQAGTPGHGIAGWVLLIAAIVIAAAAITPPVARSVVRHRRLRAAGDARLAHAAWREARDDLADYGFACRPSESPRAVAARAGSTLQLDLQAREALARIARAEERARYATAPLPAPTLRADCATIRRALARQAGRAERWRARLLPTSMLTPVRPALQQALDVFGWMDAAGMKLRGREPRGGRLDDEVRPQE
jgi:TgpA N-terminal domain/Transglutaminase-like superfamily/Domain of unknown function (DUF4129)